jgi:hypothetical protein
VKGLLLLLIGISRAAGPAALSPQHARLAAFAGSWRIHVRSWAGPGAAPQESDGSAELRRVLGGRFLEQRQRITLPGGTAAGIGYVGFDAAAGRYFSLWLDDQSPVVLRTEGAPDPSGRVIRTRGTIRDGTAGQPLRVEEVLTLVAPDRFTYEAWTGPPGGALSRVMEIVYTRRPSRRGS